MPARQVSRRHRLIGGRNREQRQEFGGADDAPRRHFERHIHRIEIRLDRHRRAIVEQDDQPLADTGERDVLAGDRGQVDLDRLVVAEFNRDGLAIRGLRDLDLDGLFLRTLRGAGRVGLGDNKRTVHAETASGTDGPGTPPSHIR